ncbi:MAG: hypothetical protein ACK52X_05405 [bacterium]
MIVLTAVAATSFASVTIPKPKNNIVIVPKWKMHQFNFLGKKMETQFVQKNKLKLIAPKTWYYSTECGVKAFTFDIAGLGLNAAQEMGFSFMLYLYAHHLCDLEKAHDMMFLISE